MKNSGYRLFGIISLFLFFLILPFIYSLMFSADTQGRIEIDKDVRAPFLKSDKKNLLVFFGYVGCGDVCVPAMEKLKRLYESDEFISLKEHTDVFFVNIIADYEETQSDLFAKYFNDDFKGISLSKKEIRNIDRNFGVYFAKDLKDDTKLDHTDHLYLIKNGSGILKLKSIYFMHPLQTDKIIKDIIEKKEL